MFNIQLLNNHGTRFVILGLTLGAIMISFSGVWVKVSHVTPTTSTFFLGFENYRLGNSFRIPDLQSLLVLLAMGLFSQSTGWILITNALPHIRASLSGLILLLQPALAFAWDVLFFQRPTNRLNWIGVCVVLLAIYFGTVRLSRPKRCNRTKQDVYPAI